MEKSSFISNFKKLPTAFLIFLAIFITGEFLIANLSNILISQRRIFNIYDSAKQKDRIDVVIIGDSATQYGIDTQVLSGILYEHKGVRAFNLGTGALQIGAEYFIIKNKIAPKKPAVIIIGFFHNSLTGTKADHLEIYHTLREYVAFGDMPVLFKVSITGLDDRLDFILRKLSYTYSYRFICRTAAELAAKKIFKKGYAGIVSFIKDRMRSNERLDLNKGFRPNLKAAEKIRINSGGEFGGIDIKTGEAYPYKYFYLNEILKIGKENNIKLLFVALPQEKKYIIAEEVKDMIDEYNMYLLDLGQEDVGRMYLADAIHLNPEGAKLLARRIADYLLRVYYKQ